MRSDTDKRIHELLYGWIPLPRALIDLELRLVAPLFGLSSGTCFELLRCMETNAVWEPGATSRRGALPPVRRASLPPVRRASLLTLPETAAPAGGVGGGSALRVSALAVLECIMARSSWPPPGRFIFSREEVAYMGAGAALGFLPSLVRAGVGAPFFGGTSTAAVVASLCCSITTMLVAGARSASAPARACHAN